MSEADRAELLEGMAEHQERSDAELDREITVWAEAVQATVLARVRVALLCHDRESAVRLIERVKASL